jgi:protein-L-isoaspartate(D-aspartate) O-methyltransferase
MTEAELAIVRRAYAMQVTAVAGVSDPRLETVLAEIRREDFLGPGPWQIGSFSDRYHSSPSDDPVYAYVDIPIGILPAKGLNNGQPSFLALLISLGELRDGEHAVHIGTGVGYYTAIISRLVGSAGRVTAIEYEPELAARAAGNLATFPNVRVIEGDGFVLPLDPADVIYVNAGAASPSEIWLDAMKEGGRMILPLTVSYTSDEGHAKTRGATFKIERHRDEYSARWMSETYIYPCAGARDEESDAALAAAFNKGGWKDVTRLYRTADIPDDNCWVRGPGWALAYH